MIRPLRSSVCTATVDLFCTLGGKMVMVCVTGRELRCLSAACFFPEGFLPRMGNTGGDSQAGVRFAEQGEGKRLPMERIITQDVRSL